jgi:hypothetical protein
MQFCRLLRKFYPADFESVNMRMGQKIAISSPIPDTREALAADLNHAT